MAMRRKRVQALLVLVALVLLGIGTLRVRAGDGMIVPNKKADGSFDQAIIQKTKVFIDAPRSQEKRTEFERQIAAANRLICDYTDGKFRFDKLQIVTHPAEKKKADIWWFNFN